MTKIKHNMLPITGDIFIKLEDIDKIDIDKFTKTYNEYKFITIATTLDNEQLVIIDKSDSNKTLAIPLDIFQNKFIAIRNESPFETVKYY